MEEIGKDEIGKDSNDFVDFGRHKGKRWTRIPVGYLFWMVSSKHSHAETARREIERRGSVVPTLDVSTHAIDRASFRLMDEWRQTRRDEEGLASWLSRMAREALDYGKQVNANRYDHAGIRFVFEDLESTEWPVVLTVMSAKERDR